MEKYSPSLADFRDWVCTEVDAQANYTDRYAPPALETYDRNGEVVNRIVLNRRYDEQHREVYRRGIIGLPYSEGAPHLLTFTMGYLLSQADISLHCPVTLTGAVAYVLGRTRRKLCGSDFSTRWCAWTGVQDRRHLGDRAARRQRRWRDHHHAARNGDAFRAARTEVVYQQCQQRTRRGDRASGRSAERDRRTGPLPGAQPSRRWPAEPLPHSPAEGQARHQGPADRGDRTAGRGGYRDRAAAGRIQVDDGGAGVQPRAQRRGRGRRAAAGVARGAGVGEIAPGFRSCAGDYPMVQDELAAHAGALRGGRAAGFRSGDRVR